MKNWKWYVMQFEFMSLLKFYDINSSQAVAHYLDELASGEDPFVRFMADEWVWTYLHSDRYVVDAPVAPLKPILSASLKNILH